MRMAPHASLILVSLVAALLLLRPAFAQDGGSAPDLPSVEAIRSPDGAYTLILVAPVAWTGAEVSVAGTDAVDLGPAKASQVVRVNGWTSNSGPLTITIRVALSSHHGVTWQFQVDPQIVPNRTPALEHSAPSKRGRRRAGH